MWMMGGVGGKVFGNLDEDIVVHLGSVTDKIRTVSIGICNSIITSGMTVVSTRINQPTFFIYWILTSV